MTKNYKKNTNNVTRFLDSKKVFYETCFFSKEKKLSAIEVADFLKVEHMVVFKSIVCLRANKGKEILAIVPSNQAVDLKKLAKVLSEKKIKTSNQEDAGKITGLQTGGISPLALLNKGFEFVIDESCLNHKFIFVSGGERGMNIKISPIDLIRLIHAKTESIFSS